MTESFTSVKSLAFMQSNSSTPRVKNHLIHNFTKVTSINWRRPRRLVLEFGVSRRRQIRLHNATKSTRPIQILVKVGGAAALLHQTNTGNVPDSKRPVLIIYCDYDNKLSILDWFPCDTNVNALQIFIQNALFHRIILHWNAVYSSSNKPYAFSASVSGYFHFAIIT
jgi:hypothetical protein